VKDFTTKKESVGHLPWSTDNGKGIWARVYAGAEKEIGWCDIELDYRGHDRLMGRLARHPVTDEILKRFKVFQWHGRPLIFPRRRTPREIRTLSESGFRFGENAYALQFHIEVKKETVYEWLKNELTDMRLLERDTELFYSQYQQRALNFYRVFFGSGSINA
jgi:GMP synthase (glutamine-hydrolysing)